MDGAVELIFNYEFSLACIGRRESSKVGCQGGAGKEISERNVEELPALFCTHYRRRENRQGERNPAFTQRGKKPGKRTMRNLDKSSAVKGVFPVENQASAEEATIVARTTPVEQKNVIINGRGRRADVLRTASHRRPLNELTVHRGGESIFFLFKPRKKQERSLEKEQIV